MSVLHKRTLAESLATDCSSAVEPSASTDTHLKPPALRQPTSALLPLEILQRIAFMTEEIDILLALRLCHYTYYSDDKDTRMAEYAVWIRHWNAAIARFFVKGSGIVRLSTTLSFAYMPVRMADALMITEVPGVGRFAGKTVHSLLSNVSAIFSYAHTTLGTDRTESRIRGLPWICIRLCRAHIDQYENNHFARGLGKVFLGHTAVTLWCQTIENLDVNMHTDILSFLIIARAILDWEPSDVSFYAPHRPGGLALSASAVHLCTILLEIIPCLVNGSPTPTTPSTPHSRIASWQSLGLTPEFMTKTWLACVRVCSLHGIHVGSILGSWPPTMTGVREPLRLMYRSPDLYASTISYVRGVISECDDYGGSLCRLIRIHLGAWSDVRANEIDSTSLRNHVISHFGEDRLRKHAFFSRFFPDSPKDKK